MELERIPESIVALYGTLAAAEAALHDLQAAGIPYPDIRLGTHTPEDQDRPAVAPPDAPGLFWSVTVLLDEHARDKAEEVLRKQQPFALGRLPAPHAGRSDTDLGAIAWRHYVFEAPAGTDQVGDSAGTTGMTGVINSGVFADDALAEGNPPARGLPPGGQRPAGAGESPTSDERRPATSQDRSRPDTELKS